MKVDFERERAWWDAKAHGEEVDVLDEAINRELRWREIERHLSGVVSILEVGGGTGAFSIPLARRGFKVTHVDFSPAMIDIAKRKAEGVDGVRFVEANSTDLPFEDQSFDLVLNMDGAISFCGAEAGRALAETCRVAKRIVIVTVANRASQIPGWVKDSIEKFGSFIPAVREMLFKGEWHQDQHPENALLAGGCTQDYVGVLKAFLPCELLDILQVNGMCIVRIGGIGSLASMCGADAVQRILPDKKLFQEFIDICDYYDKEILPEGPGTWRRAGLMGVAERKKQGQEKKDADHKTGEVD